MNTRVYLIVNAKRYIIYANDEIDEAAYKFKLFKKIQEKTIKTYSGLRPLHGYHSQADLLWPDIPFKYRIPTVHKDTIKGLNWELGKKDCSPSHPIIYQRE